MQGTSVSANNVVIDGFEVQDSSLAAFTGYGIWINPGRNGTQILNNPIQVCERAKPADRNIGREANPQVAPLRAQVLLLRPQRRSDRYRAATSVTSTAADNAPLSRAAAAAEIH